MSIFEYTKRVAIRRIVYLLIALILGIFSRCAHADDYPCSTHMSDPASYCEFKPQAYAAAVLAATERVNQAWPSGGGEARFIPEQQLPGSVVIAACQVGTGFCLDQYRRYYAQVCPVDQTYDEDTNTCTTSCPAGEVSDPEHPGQCLDSQKCLARNVNIHGDGARPWESKCISGCEIAVQPGGSQTTFNGQPIWRGRFEYSGNVCEGGVVQHPDPDGTRTDEKTKPQECVSTGAGSRACVKPNGDTCYTTTAGRQTCWGPGETGQKTDGPIAQQRKPGDVQAPPNIQLPNGDTANKSGDSVKTTTTTTNNTVTTTTTNYVAVSGANAGTKNEGESDSGEDIGQEDGNQSSGGQNCTTAPTSSGDPILGNILFQTWKTRCDGEDNQASGAGNCEAAFECSGDEILCSIAMEKRKERCDYESRRTTNTQQANSIIAQGDGLDGITVEGMFASNQGLQINDGLLGGGGAGQCDFTFTLGGQMIEMDGNWWTVVALIKAIVVILAYLWIIRQLGK